MESIIEIQRFYVGFALIVGIYCLHEVYDVFHDCRRLNEIAIIK